MMASHNAHVRCKEIQVLPAERRVIAAPPRAGQYDRQASADRSVMAGECNQHTLAKQALRTTQ